MVRPQGTCLANPFFYTLILHTLAAVTLKSQMRMNKFRVQSLYKVRQQTTSVPAFPCVSVGFMERSWASRSLAAPLALSSNFLGQKPLAASTGSKSSQDSS